jgi:hypothetical protein
METNDFSLNEGSAVSKDKSNLVIGITAVVILVLFVAVLAWLGFRFFGGNQVKAAAQAEEFINTNFLAGQAEKAKVKVVGKVNGLYKLEVEFQGTKIDSYMSLDGKKFFPEAYDMTPEGQVAGEQDANTPTTTDLPKTDKPVVELFVMSYCPYGTQVQKGIMPAIDALGGKVDFKLKFVDYIMHDKIEIEENLRQYCIDGEQKDKLSAYLTCFLKTEDSATCLKTAKVDEGKLITCYNATDKKFKVMENYTNKVGWKGQFPGFGVNGEDNVKYGVQGSPTLVINGVQASSGRDSASLLKAICSAFTNPPAECGAQLSSATPAPGFGDGTTGAATNASCN